MVLGSGTQEIWILVSSLCVNRQLTLDKFLCISKLQRMHLKKRVHVLEASAPSCEKGRHLKPHPSLLLKELNQNLHLNKIPR